MNMSNSVRSPNKRALGYGNGRSRAGQDQEDPKRHRDNNVAPIGPRPKESQAFLPGEQVKWGKEVVYEDTVWNEKEPFLPFMLQRP